MFWIQVVSIIVSINQFVIAFCSRLGPASISKSVISKVHPFKKVRAQGYIATGRVTCLLLADYIFSGLQEHGDFPYRATWARYAKKRPLVDIIIDPD